MAAIDILIAAGIMPQDAELALSRARAAGQEMPQEFDAERAGDVSEADLETARAWWFYNPDVPVEWKRILTAVSMEEI